MVDVASGPIVPMYTPSSTASKSRAKADARPSTRADYIEPGEKIAGAEAVRACEKSPSCSADLLGPPDAEGLPTRCSADLRSAHTAGLTASAKAMAVCRPASAKATAVR